MDPVEMLAWREFLMHTPEAILAEILGDRDKLGAYVEAEMRKSRKPSKEWWQFWQ